MNCTDHQHQHQDQEMSSLIEEIGDSEATNLELNYSYRDQYYDDGDDGRESCNNGYIDGQREDDDDDDDDGDEDDDEKVMTWSTWIEMERSEWEKRDEKKERFSLVVDEEENRLFWETCLASGYP